MGIYTCVQHGVLSDGELRRAREAAGRYSEAAFAERPLPEGLSSGRGQNVLANGFAFHASLALLAVHPVILPIVRELTGNRPQLRRGSLLCDHPQYSSSDGVPLHSGREDYQERKGGPLFPHKWFWAEGDQLRCSDFVVFPYLDSVQPGGK